MRELVHAHPPRGMRSLSLASYAVLTAIGSRYITKDAQAVDAVVFWYIHTAPIHDAMALSQVSAAHAEVIALAACDLPADALDEIDAYAKQSFDILDASRSESRGVGGNESKN